MYIFQWPYPRENIQKGTSTFSLRRKTSTSSDTLSMAEKDANKTRRVFNSWTALDLQRLEAFDDSILAITVTPWRLKVVAVEKGFSKFEKSWKAVGVWTGKLMLGGGEVAKMKHVAVQGSACRCLLRSRTSCSALKPSERQWLSPWCFAVVSSLP